MPDVLYPPARPLSVGEILDLAFRIFRATVVTCLPFAAVAVVAGQLPTLYNVLLGRPLLLTPQQNRDPIWWMLELVALLLFVLLISAVLLRQHTRASASGAAAGGSLATALRRLPGLLLLTLLSGLVVGLCFVPVALFQGATALLVAVVLSIPATYLWVMLSFAVPVLLFTGRGVLASAAHSWRLTSGSFWRVTLIYTVGVVLLLVVNLLSSIIGLAIAVPLGGGDLAVITAVTSVVGAILGSLGMPFFTALWLAMYGDLSVRREGTDLAGRIAAAAPP